MCVSAAGLVFGFGVEFLSIMVGWLLGEGNLAWCNDNFGPKAEYGQHIG